MADTSSLVRKVETRAGFIAQRLGLDVGDALRASAAPHKKSGELQAAIKVTHARLSPTRWRIHAKAEVIQAATLEHGARPHVIEPRNKKALSFTSGGTKYVVRRVNHPGNRPTHWFSEVVNIMRVRTILSRFVGR